MVDDGDADEDRKRVERSKLDALLGWCELECQRQALLGYFGEEVSTPCGNCDVCLEPPETWDATVPAQKLISCVLRTEQRFGGAHVIDVLLGKKTDKVVQHHHDTLSTFGIGDELDEKGWRSVLRQLVVRAYLSADPERFNALRMTQQARPLLKSEETLQLRRDPKPARSQPPQRERRIAPRRNSTPEALFSSTPCAPAAANSPRKPGCRLRRVPRRHADRYGTASPDDARRNARGQRRWRSEARKIWRRFPRSGSERRISDLSPP